jgi:hypothetical protein
MSGLRSAIRAAARSLLDFLRGFTGVHAARLATPDRTQSDVRGEVRKALAAEAEHRPRCC